ncbi:hypothetical protein [Streptomyces sp. NPDC047315]|uniref:acyl carrier protein n=1 Tax=Streptomyces sp. NPDC047315 TaxID=3155142 RepID=UPI0033E37FBE
MANRAEEGLQCYRAEHVIDVPWETKERHRPRCRAGGTKNRSFGVPYVPPVVSRVVSLGLVRDSIVQVVPGVGVAALERADAFRPVLEMDSLDFLRFVEMLSRRSGIPIGDEDVPHLVTFSACVDCLLTHAG